MNRAVIVAGLLGVLQATAGGAEFFLLSQPEQAIYRFDTAVLGKSVRVGSIEPEGALMALVDAGDGRLWTFDGVSDEIITFDVAKGVETARVKLDCDIDEHVRGFARDSGGKLFGIFPGIKLATIDPDTGTTTPLATVHGAARVEAIAFGPGNRLFAVGSTRKDGSSESLYRLDLQTGKLDRIGPHGFADVDTLTFGGDTYFYGTNSRDKLTNELLRLSPRGAKGQLVGDTGVRGVNGVVRVPPVRK